MLIKKNYNVKYIMRNLRRQEKYYSNKLTDIDLLTKINDCINIWFGRLKNRNDIIDNILQLQSIIYYI